MFKKLTLILLFAFLPLASQINKRPLNRPQALLEQQRQRFKGVNEDLIDAVFLRDVEKANQALEKGADPNLIVMGVGGSLRRILHVAAARENQQIVELLIAAGADVCARDENGATVTDYAFNREIRELLRAERAKCVGSMTGEDLKQELEEEARQEQQSEKVHEGIETMLERSRSEQGPKIVFED